MNEQQEMQDLIIERDVLAQDRKRLVALVERFKQMYDLMVAVDGQYAVEEILDHQRQDSTEGTAAYGEWLALMDSDFGVMAQYHQTGQYADNETLTDVMMNREGQSMLVEMRRLLAIQAELIDRIKLARKELEQIPEAKITPENTRFVLETVNFAYSYLVDVNETMLDTLLNSSEG